MVVGKRSCMTKSITVADYLYAALDAKRVVDDEGEKESWTEYFCKTYGIRYRPHGLSRRTNGRVGRPPRIKRD